MFEDGALINNLSETITALSGVDDDDFLCHTQMVFRFQSDLFRVSGSTREMDEALLEQVMSYADAALDGLRFTHCRLDVPHLEIGQPGFLPKKNMLAMFCVDKSKNDGRVISREPNNPIVLPGLGLEIDRQVKYYRG